jgi:phage tail sheath gpL-like
MMMRFHSGLAAMLVVIATSSGARADDVTDQINEALKAYQNHDAQTAIAALDGAANLLRQARAEGLKKLLPPVLPGWTADAAEATAVGSAMLGGGTTASRTYHNGPQQVEVQIMADSPMLQGMAALLGSPFAAASGLKTVVIGGRRMSYSDSDNSYMTLVADKVIVKVEGNKDTPDPTLKSIVGAIDFPAIEKLVR